jgi:hypothetical protein
VASSKALNLLHQAMCAVTYRRIAMAIKTASFVRVFVDCCLFACSPDGRWGNTEQVVAQCQHPVASGVALDMLHWAMRFVLHRQTAMAIKWPTTEEHVDGIIDFVIRNNQSLIPCSSHYKLKPRYSNIYYNVISLIVYYWLPSATMDAVLATIVAERDNP